LLPLTELGASRTGGNEELRGIAIRVYARIDVVDDCAFADRTQNRQQSTD
jgi:hypothetical protein